MKRTGMKLLTVCLALTMMVGTALGATTAFAAESAQPKTITDPIAWIETQLQTDGTVLYDYFETRSKGSSLDSLGPNFAPSVNQSLRDGGVTGSFSYRVYKLSDKNKAVEYNITWSNSAIDTERVGKQLLAVVKYNTVSKEKEYGHLTTMAKKNPDVIVLDGGSLKAHIEGEAVVTEADCTHEGSSEIHCTACGELLNSTVIPMKAHVYGDWEVVTEATYEADGKEVCHCQNCSATMERAIPAKVHDFKLVETVEATCGEAGKKVYHCDECNTDREEVIPATGAHQRGEWVTVTPATEEAEGLETVSCTVCHQVLEQRAIDRLPASDSSTEEPKKDDTSSTVVVEDQDVPMANPSDSTDASEVEVEEQEAPLATPQTGVSVNTAVIVILLSAAGILAGLIAYGRKEQR